MSANNKVVMNVKALNAFMWSSKIVFGGGVVKDTLIPHACDAVI